MSHTTSLLGQFLAPYREAFRIEAFRHFIIITAAWILTPRKHTIAQVAPTAHFAYGQEHHALYHCLNGAVIDDPRLDEVRLQLLIQQFAPEGIIEVVIDDTLSHKRGAKICGGGMFLDAVHSTHATKNFRFGLHWVVLALVVGVPGRNDRVFAVPIAWRLAPKRPKVDPESVPKSTEIARDLLAWLASQLPERNVRILGDSAYLNQTIAKDTRLQKVDFLGPMPRTAAFYRTPCPRRPGQRGASRKKGDRLPKPADTFDDWTRQKTCSVTITTGPRQKTVTVVVREDVLWYGTFAGRVGRVILVRDESGGWKDTAFWTTDLTTPIKELLTHYTHRWSIEVLFRDSKQYCGLHDPQVRTSTSVTRAHGHAWVVIAEVMRWFAAEGHRFPRVDKTRAWYPHPPTPTIIDMLETMRLALWQEALLQEDWQHLSPEKCRERLLHWAAEFH